MIKPHINKSTGRVTGGLYECYGWGASGWGETPVLAYQDWRAALEYELNALRQYFIDQSKVQNARGWREIPIYILIPITRAESNVVPRFIGTTK